MRLKRFLTAAALVAGVMAVPACGPATVSTAGFVTSGDCPREQAVVTRALRRSTLRVDVSGDGRLDRVAAASDPAAPKPCRAFVGVHVQGGSTYSAHLFPSAVPVKGLRARIIGVPHLGDVPGAEIVVDTTAAVDSVLAQMFTLVGGTLRPVPVPGFQDGTFIVEGGGVMFPHGAGCTAEGRLVLSAAAQTKDGSRYRVTRRTYGVLGRRIRLVDPQRTKETVPVGELVARFPEFAGPHWAPCTGIVRGPGPDRQPA